MIFYSWGKDISCVVYPWDNVPEIIVLGAIVRGAIIRWAIIQGTIVLGGDCPDTGEENLKRFGSFLFYFGSLQKCK